MKIGGKERKFKYGLNSIRALVRETGKTPQEILEGGFDPRDVEFGVLLVWAALIWQDRNLAVDQVGDWLDSEEGLYLDAAQEAINALLEGFKRTFRLEGHHDEGEEPGKN